MADAQGRFPILYKKSNKLIAPDELRLSGLYHIRCDTIEQLKGEEQERSTTA